MRRFHIDDSKPPPLCHKVVPIPIHWRDKVKADLDRDVQLGVLRKVPENTPVKYLSRMVYLIDFAISCLFRNTMSTESIRLHRCAVRAPHAEKAQNNYVPAARLVFSLLCTIQGDSHDMGANCSTCCTQLEEASFCNSIVKP